MEGAETFDPLRTRPDTPVKVVWYDFLLDDGLLERHLNQENPEPPALHLAAEFVYQYQCTLQHLRETKASSVPPADAPSNGAAPTTNSDSNGGAAASADSNVLVEENRKCLALRLLALKVLAFLNWDLNFFETKLPLCMVHLLLTEFLRMTAVPDERVQGLRPSELDQTMLPDHTVFSLLLYHRWCLRTMVDSTLPKKPVKNFPVNVPGLQDPTVVAPSSYENTVKMVKEQVNEAVKLVEVFLQSTRSIVVVPNLVSLGQLSETPAAKTEENGAKPNSGTAPSILLRWELGTQVPVEELVCQAAYDLGVYYFHMGDYEKAGFLLQTCGNLFSQVQDSPFCTLNFTDLDGYMQACSDVTGEKFSSAPSKPTLLERLVNSEKNNFKDLPSILSEDNVKMQIPRSHRESFVKRHLSSMPSSMRRQVAMSNVLHRVVSSDVGVSPDELVDVRIYEKAEATAFAKAFEPLIKNHYDKKAQLRFFLVQFLSSHVSSQFLKQLVENKTLSSILLAEDVDLLARKTRVASAAAKDDGSASLPTSASAACRLAEWPLSNDAPVANNKKASSSPSRELSVGRELAIGSLEHRLIMSRNAGEIFQLLKSLRNAAPNKMPFVKLHQAWETLQLSQEIYNCLADKFDQDYVTIVFAKATQCLQMKAFDQARELLQAARTHCGNLPHGGKRIAAIADWETLLVGLTQYRETDTVSVSSGLTASDLVNRVKSCLTSLGSKPNPGFVPPSIEVIEQSVAFLINIKEWSTLWGYQQQMNNHMELGRLLCNTCKELPNTKNARKPAKELFEGVLSIFRTVPFQGQKRGVGGNPINNPQNRETGLLPKQLFLNFLASLKEPVVMSTLISLLAKIFNVLKDESGKEVHGEHQDAWPANNAVGNADQINLPSVTETLEYIVEHALATDATHASWILTQADIHFARGQHAPALRRYVEAGFVSSAAFSKPVPKDVYSDSVLRRMIKCCSALKCHTQVAVLCQFLDETDYVIAFKALQEKQVVADAMDNYYDCIWDTTVLEYLANLHIRRGEMQKHKLVLEAFRHLDLNPNNSDDVLDRAVQLRKSKFMRALSRQYMLS